MNTNYRPVTRGRGFGGSSEPPFFANPPSKKYEPPLTPTSSCLTVYLPSYSKYVHFQCVYSDSAYRTDSSNRSSNLPPPPPFNSLPDRPTTSVVPPLWRLGGFGAVMFGNTAELGGQGFQWGNSVWWNLHHDNWKIIFYFITPRYFYQFLWTLLIRTWIFLYVYINVNYVCSIDLDHYTFGGSHASDIITCLNGSLLGITNHI